MNLISDLYSIFRNIKSYLRILKHQSFGVHPTFLISKDCYISKDFVTGKYGYLGYGSHICTKVKFGNYVLCGPRVTFVGSDHNFHIPGVPIIFSGRPEMPHTNIGSDCWIGANATIIAGVTIGHGTIIAANAVLTKDAEPFSVYAGIPAKKIRDRFSNVSERKIHERMIHSEPSKGVFCSNRF